jgi:hypothetical protein
MAIASLTNISASKFAGGANLAVAAAGATALSADIQAIMNKINEIVSDVNTGALDVLEVGGGIADYYAGNDSWLSIDGTNPPTVSALRMIDVDTAGYRTVQMASGVLTVI